VGSGRRDPKIKNKICSTIEKYTNIKHISLKRLSVFCLLSWLALCCTPLPCACFSFFLWFLFWCTFLNNFFSLFLVLFNFFIIFLLLSKFSQPLSIYYCFSPSHTSMALMMPYSSLWDSFFMSVPSKFRSQCIIFFLIIFYIITGARFPYYICFGTMSRRLGNGTVAVRGVSDVG